MSKINFRKVRYDENKPAVYVGTYGKYASGDISGAWISPGMYDSLAECLAACADIHSDELEGQRELMFQDYSGFPGMLYDEAELTPELFAYCKAVEEVEDPAALDAYIEIFGSNFEDPDDLLEAFNERFYGAFDSDVEATSEWAEDMLEAHKVPHQIALYFDYDAFARDRMIDTFDERNGYYFWAC